MRRIKEGHSEQVYNMLIRAFRGETDIDYIAEDITKGIAMAAEELNPEDDGMELLNLIEEKIWERM